MPYYRRRRTYAPRRRTYRRRPMRYRSRPLTYGQIGTKIFRDVNRLKNLINVEFKYNQNTFDTTVDNAGTMHHINVVSQGDGPALRDGAQVRFKSLQFKGRVTMNASATHTQFRLIIFILKRVNQTAPAVTDILDSASTISLKNLDNRRNYVILSDRVYNLEPETRTERNFQFYRKLDMKTIWARASSGGGSSDTEQNGLYALLISSNSINTPTVNIHFRTSFIDN